MAVISPEVGMWFAGFATGLGLGLIVGSVLVLWASRPK